MAAETNPYAYLDRDAFSSEKYKIEVSGLPKYFGLGHFKKFLSKEGINAHKIKPVGDRPKFAYICFREDAEKEQAIEKLNGAMYKGSKLSAKVGKPSKDPLIRKRKLEEENPDQQKEDNTPVAEKVETVTLPYKKLSMKEQHDLKKKYVEEAMQTYSKELKRANHALFKTLGSGEGDVCPIDDTVASPEDDRYRNKCDFTIGVDPESNLPTVGFRLASYKKGVCSVAPISHLTHLPTRMIEAVKKLEEYIRTTEHPPFNPEDHSGVWRNVVIRVTQNDEAMAILVLHPQSFTDDEKLKLKDGLKEFVYASGIFTSFFVQFQGTKRSNEEPPLEKLVGQDHINEKLLGLNFRISPLAFFQTNTKAAEVLYQLVGDIANVSQNSIVLDICCGTGTIGLSLARRCKKVYGIELIPSAVDDARANAEANNVDNCEFIAGRAEDKMFQLLDTLKEEDDIVAIVDPPRAGLHPKCTQALRKAEKIKLLVYVSCDAKCAMKSFVDLSRATSNTYVGDPFVPKRAIPVDMFPHTAHCETVILFER